MSSEKQDDGKPSAWGRLFGGRGKTKDGSGKTLDAIPKWSMGVMNDKDTVEVPGSVLLLAAHRNEPLGLRNVHARTSHSSIPAGFPVDVPLTPGGTRPMPTSPGAASDRRRPSVNPHDEADDKKKTEDGAIILEPQPDDSANDPLNWPNWRRDLALLSLGFYCMVGGGITPIMAAGFQNIATQYNVPVERVSLTTGLYMMGLGMGSVFASPTAILFGKRPVYLVSSLIFIGTSLWAGFSPSFSSLLAARVFQGMAVSPVECLPSATIAEIFFLHERAFRIGIYTLLLLSGKNLVPLVSAAIIGRFGWRWVFWIVSIVVALGGCLLFFFVPETFWDRTPSRKPSKRPSFLRRLSSRAPHLNLRQEHPRTSNVGSTVDPMGPASPGAASRHRDLHVGFAPGAEPEQGAVPAPLTPARSGEGNESGTTPVSAQTSHQHHQHKDLHVGFAEGSELEKQTETGYAPPRPSLRQARTESSIRFHEGTHATSADPEMMVAGRPVPIVHIPGETSQVDGAYSIAGQSTGPASVHDQPPPSRISRDVGSPYSTNPEGSAHNIDYYNQGPTLAADSLSASSLRAMPKVKAYTHNLRQQPAKSFTQQLKPFHGRLNNDKWIKVMLRPFILFAYPAVLWSSAVYACSIGWLIVMSETLSLIYRDQPYNFTALQAGLVYISPFIGGILGTAVAGRISDIIVRYMSRRNGGLYEPEFRLVMAIPILLSTCIGLMGFGWSAHDDDAWIVPTLFFGIVSFGCSLGSTTSITFCVDSYRQYAGEALVTLNFSKNIFHGLIFSLFVTNWLEDDGSKSVYMWLGIIQLLVLLTSIPMYIFGKRARMWTARKNLMEKF